jgi:hypothetical protein
METPYSMGMSHYNESFCTGEDVLTLAGAQLNAAIARQLGSSETRDFATNIFSLISLALPDPTDCYQDWIHTEHGPSGRWIVRLMRFYRTDPTQPWKSKELYVADADEEVTPLATAYGRAWLFSHKTWPPGHTKSDYRLAS